MALGAPVLDRERARAAFQALRELRDELAPGSEVPLSLLGAIPDLFVSSVEREIDRLREATRARLRRRGRRRSTRCAPARAPRCAEDLVKRLERVRRLARDVERRAPDVLEAHRKRLRERADRLRIAAEIDVDAARLEQEIAMFAERMRHLRGAHAPREPLRAVRGAARQPTRPSAGGSTFSCRRWRARPTPSGAKSPDAQIAHAIVEVKAEIERMREQVQNVE